jgi:MSHA biogenesis protein MshI
MPLQKYGRNPAYSCAPVRSSPLVPLSLARAARYPLQKRRIGSEVALLPLFKKSKKGNGRIGIAFGDGLLALALVNRQTDGKPSLQHCTTQAYEGDAASALKPILDKLGARRAKACAVIDGDDYQVVQVEAPEVLPSEMRAAIRWRLRDAIGFSVDEAAVDVFEIPDPIRRTQQKMLFAVAARDSAVQRISAAVKPASKGFEAIDIPELCLRNISTLLPQDAKGVAMLALSDTFAQLVLTRQGTLYLTRKIDTSRRFSPHTQDRADIDAASLALELQRSLDYYESQYDQTPIGDLVIAPADDRARALAEGLRGETSLRIQVLDVREILSVYKTGEFATDWPTLIALGAALRTDSSES